MSADGAAALVEALLFRAGYNTTLVSIGAALLGASAAAIGSFVLLRKRSLVSDAISHATLPGLALAFILMALATGDGRFLPGLLLGAALSAGLGLHLVEWITRRTRLGEDAAIGAVLSTFFGLGVVLLTVIQTLETGRQAGIAGYLLGSTAGMLRSEAMTIALAALGVGLAIFALRRPFTLMCFDPDYARSRGIDLRRADLAMMALLLAVTVIGLKVAGLVLIVALTIIPPVAARFWTDRPGAMVVVAAVLGAIAAHAGAAISATADDLPTGAVIVLVAFLLFVLSLLLAPTRGLFAGRLQQLALRRRVHERQGLLALAHGEPIYDPLTRRVLLKAGHTRADGVATPDGLAAAAATVRDEALWRLYRRSFPDDPAGLDHHGLVPITDAVPGDVLAGLTAELDRAGAPA